MASSSSEPAASRPRDERRMHALLASMGVDDYEPRVLHQLLEYKHRYCAEVFSDSAQYAEHAGRAGRIEAEDVLLSARLQEAASQPAPPQLVRHLARKCNNKPIGAVPLGLDPRFPSALRFPNEALCMVQENYQLLPRPPPDRNDGVAQPAPPPPRVPPPAGGGAGKRTIPIKLQARAAAAPTGGGAAADVEMRDA